MTDPLFLAVILVAGFFSGATAAVIGFGVGSLLTPLLLTRLEPHLAVSLVALPHLLATTVRYFQHRRWVDRGVLLRFGIPSAVGGLVGALVQLRFRSSALILTLGILLVLTGIANLSGGFAGWRPGRAAGAALGLVSGLFGGLVGNQGGLRAAGLTAFALDPRAYLATGTAVGVLIDLARTPVYLVQAGERLLPYMSTIGVASVGCLAGTIAGERLFLRIPAEKYRKVVGAAVIVLGIWLTLRPSG